VGRLVELVGGVEEACDAGEEGADDREESKGRFDEELCVYIFWGGLGSEQS